MDLEVEAGAVALAYVQKPCTLKATALEYWSVLSEIARDTYRYQACVVLEAVDELKGIRYAAE
jgi:hypothetical protein